MDAEFAARQSFVSSPVTAAFSNARRKVSSPLRAAVSAIFALTLFTQYRAKHRPYLLAWALALAFYAIAALTEVIGAAGGWNPLLFRTYYFFGAILLVGLLALGTTYLLAPRFSGIALWILIDPEPSSHPFQIRS